jgi:hypothetical protein
MVEQALRFREQGAPAAPHGFHVERSPVEQQGSPCA